MRLDPIYLDRTSRPIFAFEYDWDMDGDNHEWRDYVSQFLKLAETMGHSVAVVDVPPFRAHEDFVVITYAIDNNSVNFSSDSLLWSIYAEPKDALSFASLWSEIGNQIGWRIMATQAEPKDQQQVEPSEQPIGLVGRFLRFVTRRLTG